MKTFKFKNELIEIPLKRIYSLEDSQIIREGFRAPSMDDKWDILFQNNELSSYRSRTGIGLFKIKFTNIKSQLQTAECFVDEKFLDTTSISYCIELINWLSRICFIQKEN